MIATKQSFSGASKRYTPFFLGMIVDVSPKPGMRRQINTVMVPVPARKSSGGASLPHQHRRKGRSMPDKNRSGPPHHSPETDKPYPTVFASVGAMGGMNGFLRSTRIHGALAVLVKSARCGAMKPRAALFRRSALRERSWEEHPARVKSRGVLSCLGQQLE